MSLLGGVRVLDLAYGSAGPLAAQYLADQGAEIIRVDPPGTLRREPRDAVRLRGRRSITLDLAAADAAALLELLVARSDVLLAEPAFDAAGPSLPDYGRLAATNPRLVYCRIGGYGDDGPLAASPAHDHLVAARFGVQDQPGWRDGPTYVVAPVPSLGAALLAVQGIGSALYQRERTGAGQEVSVSLLAGALAYQPSIMSASNGLPPGPPPAPRTPAGAAPFYRLYQCADGLYLQLACLTPPFQAKAARALDIEADLTVLGFGTPAAAEADNRAAIVERVGRRMKDASYAEWAAVLEAHDVPYARALSSSEFRDDPQLAHERLLIPIDDPVAGPTRQPGPAVLAGDEEWQTPRPAPTPGQHTDEVCAELGLSPERIAALRATGAIA